MEIDLTTISAAVTVAKTAVDTLKTAFSAKEKIGAEREVNEAFENLGKVQDKLIELRAAIMSLQDENHRLATELRAQNTWSDKAAKYELNRSALGGDFAYLFIGDPTHWACPTCFESEKISVLQPWDEETGALRCHVCRTSYHLQAVNPNNSRRLEPDY
jgi:hypothetical protein